jgi:hypothetical protein
MELQRIIYDLLIASFSSFLGAVINLLLIQVNIKTGRMLRVILAAIIIGPILFITAQQVYPGNMHQFNVVVLPAASGFSGPWILTMYANWLARQRDPEKAIDKTISLATKIKELFKK